MQYLLAIVAYVLLADLFYRLARGCLALYGREEWNFTLWGYVRETATLFRARLPDKSLGRACWKASSYYLFMLCATLALGSAYVAFDGHIYKTAFSAIFALPLLAMCYVDFRTQYLPDFLMWTALAWSLAQVVCEIFMPWQQALIGGAAGFGVLWGVNAIFKLIRKKDGMGGGDFKLAGILGLWVGLYPLPYLLFLSAFVGLIGAIFAALLSRSKIPQRFAYGPALALAGWALLLVGRYFFP